MTARDRVMAALAHTEPDRIPWDYWAAPEITERLMAHLRLPDTEALLRHLDVDLRTVAGPSYAGQEFRTHPDGTVDDLWGVRRRRMTVERGGTRWPYKHVAQSPLEPMESAAEVDAYPHWPSPDWWDYSGVAEECSRHQGYAVVNAGDRLDRTAQLKPMMYLRGMEQAYVDLRWNPEVVDAILAHIRGYFLEYNRRVFEAAAGRLDVLMMGDDFGTQSGPMMDMGTWRRFFKEGFHAYIELAHRYGIRVMHHTCGSVGELIPDFIDCGLDILQSLQPAAAGMDLARLKREFGKDLSFHGSIDIQHVLPHGNREEIRAMVRDRAAACRPGGGFIVCTAKNIKRDTRLENVLALLEAFRELGE